MVQKTFRYWMWWNEIFKSIFLSTPSFELSALNAIQTV